ncbi:MAG: type II secretion system protein [Campylobacter sp.]|nr:type II secretion system protein [Campylobacter sp.]
MKKGFTMIELIFVIVILGILASVAIPRLAATREDAEISAAVANLRTLLSDVSSYYAAKGNLTGAKWIEITNLPLKKGGGGYPVNAENTVTKQPVFLKVGNVNDCIGVNMVDKRDNTPAYIEFIKKSTNGVCKQFLDSEPLKAYFDSRVNGAGNKSAMAIGSNISIYD